LATPVPSIRATGQADANRFPEAVVISMKKYEGLLETLEILSDEMAMKSLRKSIKEAQKGKWLTHDEVFGE
jgi:PHD/YefM family antitoxin component YafN of YafNO toxin-antitoxin module